MVIKPNSTTSSSQVNITDRDIIILILEFLDSKNLNIAQIALERETGVVNGVFTDEVLFLRNLIIDGSWDEAVDYVEPLQQAPTFDYNLFKKIIYQYKFLELLCIKNEIGNTKFSQDAAVDCLKELETFCDKNEFNNFRLLLSYQNIQDHPDYHDWNPSSARAKCFRELRPLVEGILQVDNMQSSESAQSPPSRLIHLLVKGILYETAARLCAQRAKKVSDDLRFTSLLPKSSASPDMTLLSWLQAIPAEIFTQQFEEKNIPLNYHKFEKPLLETTWTEHIQSQPIRTKAPLDGYPSPTPSRSSDRMVQSMVEQMDGFRKKGLGSSSARQRGLSQSFHLGGLGQEDPFLSGMFSGPGSVATSRSARAALSNQSAEKRAPYLQSSSDDEVPSVNGNLPSAAGQQQPIVPSDRRENYAEPLSPITESAQSFELDEPGLMVLSAFHERPQLDSERKRLQEEWKERDRQRELLMAEIVGSSSNTSFPSVPPITPLIQKIDSPTSDIQEPSPDIINSSLPASQRQPLPGNMPYDKQRTPEGSLASSVQASSRFVGSPDSVVSNKPAELESGSRIFQHQKSTEPRFVKVQVVEDGMFVRCAAFHPSGNFYAVGSNSRTLRICSYPDSLRNRSLRPEQTPVQAPVIESRVNYHKGSIFCVAWNGAGNLLASGSNDKKIRLSRFDPEAAVLQDGNMDLSIHDDTVRDIIFMDDARSASNTVLISGGADSKIYLTDGTTGSKFQRFTDHSAVVLSLHAWPGAMFVSGSQDKTCRVWDLRSLTCAKLFDQKRGLPAHAVTCVRVDQTGKVLVTAHENGECSLWDLRAEKIIQVIKPHDKEIRGLSLSGKTNLLLTASYDRTVLAHSMDGNLYAPLPAVVAAAHDDKVIQCHMHPTDVSFLTTSADKTCALWGYPEVPV